MEMVEIGKRMEIVNLYGQKLNNSGFRIAQITKGILGGLMKEDWYRV